MILKCAGFIYRAVVHAREGFSSYFYLSNERENVPFSDDILKS